jgi:hypothetical protein
MAKVHHEPKYVVKTGDLEQNKLVSGSATSLSGLLTEVLSGIGTGCCNVGWTEFQTIE